MSNEANATNYATLSEQVCYRLPIRFRCSRTDIAAFRRFNLMLASPRYDEKIGEMCDCFNQAILQVGILPRLKRKLRFCSAVRR